MENQTLINDIALTLEEHVKHINDLKDVVKAQADILRDFSIRLEALEAKKPPARYVKSTDPLSGFQKKTRAFLYALWNEFKTAQIVVKDSDKYHEIRFKHYITQPTPSIKNLEQRGLCTAEWDYKNRLVSFSLSDRIFSQNGLPLE